jgi:hypothetical protein
MHAADVGSMTGAYQRLSIEGRRVIVASIIYHHYRNAGHANSHVANMGLLSCGVASRPRLLLTQYRPAFRIPRRPTKRCHEPSCEWLRGFMSLVRNLAASVDGAGLIPGKWGERREDRSAPRGEKSRFRDDNAHNAVISGRFPYVGTLAGL